MKRLLTWLIILALSLGAIEVARRLGGSDAAGLVFMIIAVCIGVDFAVTWGNKQAAETDKYRQALISGQKVLEADAPLVPGPDDVASWIRAAVMEPWPATERERRAYFSKLRLVPGRETGTEHPSVSSGLLTASSLGGAEGIWTALDGRLLSVNLALYTGPRAGSVSSAELGYRALREKLLEMLGSPSEEDAGEQWEPVMAWEKGGILLEVWCHSRRTSSLEIGFTHLARSREYDALLETPTDQP